MKKSFLLIPLLLLAACDSPKKTLDGLQNEIAAYSIEPTPDAEQKIDAGFEKLDADIAKLNDSGKSAEAAALQRQVDALRSLGRFAPKSPQCDSGVRSVGQKPRRANRRGFQAHADAAGKLTIQRVIPKSDCLIALALWRGH